MNEKCFGMGKKGMCTVLREKNCPGYAACPFYKPKWKAEADQEAANARLRNLPMVEQEYIAEKYHKGNAPWCEGGKLE